jgi:hypothetical protein
MECNPKSQRRKMPQHPYQNQGTEYAPQMTPARLSQVDNQMTQIEKSLAEAMSIVDSLQNKLAVVLREDGPRLNPVESDRKEPEILVPLAGALRDKRRQIDLLGERLNGILTRIEL